MLQRWSDFVALPDEDHRELVDGRLEEVETPTKWHEAMVAVLILQSGLWCRRRKFHVLGSGFEVRISGA